MSDALLAPLARLRDRVARHAVARRTETPVPGLVLHRASAATAPAAGLLEPRVCLVVQGAKEVRIGEATLRYGAGACFIAAVELPATGWVAEASAEAPYLSLTLGLDPAIVGALMPLLPARTPHPPAGAPMPRVLPGFGVGDASDALLAAADGLLALLDAPADIPALAEARRRELHWRVLQGELGSYLVQVAASDPRAARLRRSLAWIRAHYDAPLDVATLAAMADMSRPTFHRLFKAATSLSPIQYQKSLRLQQAGHLLATRRAAQDVAFAVGYGSPSQFSRDYARMFGAPPGRDGGRLQRGADEHGT